jgi:TRAP-type C4-dicarboxylate transport system substrate-binding protein
VVGAVGRPYGRCMTRTALTSLLAVALLAGCGAENSDRAGGEKPVKAKVLVMANANFGLEELEAFDEAVERASGGGLRIKWLNEYGHDRDGNAEINVIRDVGAGKVDLGWAATRIFDELGVAAFNPLHAPMLVDSYELEEKVLSDGLVAPMLESLGDLGLRGIGVLPGPLRRPFGKHPLRGTEDWAGARIGSSGGNQVEKALRSLGATRELEFGRGETDKLDGLDTHIAVVPANHYHYDLPFLTANLVLWPRPLVLFAGPKVSSGDVAVVREAAKEAIPEAIALSRSQESEALSEICRAAVKVVSASPGQVDGLRAAFRPVYDELARDDAASEAVARIQELSRDGGSGVHPVRCPAASKAAAATIPPGTYRTVLTRADAREHGWPWAHVVEEDPDPKALTARTREVRLEFSDQGTFLVRNVWLDGTPNIEWEGTYSIYRDRITVEGNEGTKITARVELDADRLRFTDVQPGPKGPEAFTWGSKPFVRIG